MPSLRGPCSRDELPQNFGWADSVSRIPTGEVKQSTNNVAAPYSDATNFWMHAELVISNRAVFKSTARIAQTDVHQYFPHGHFKETNEARCRTEVARSERLPSQRLHQATAGGHSTLLVVELLVSWSRSLGVVYEIGPNAVSSLGVRRLSAFGQGKDGSRAW